MSDLNKRLDVSAERSNELTKEGDLNSIIEKIAEESGLEYKFVVSRLPKLIAFLTERQSYVFRSHYMYRKSIVDIRYELGAGSNVSIERSLKSAEKRIIKICKEIKSDLDDGVITI